MAVEQQILNESEAFLVTKKERNFRIETIFDWNEMSIGDILEINKVNLNGLLEQWKKSICKKRSCYHQDAIVQNREKNESVEKQTDIVQLDEIESNSGMRLRTSVRLGRVTRKANHVRPC